VGSHLKISGGGPRLESSHPSVKLKTTKRKNRARGRGTPCHKGRLGTGKGRSQALDLGKAAGSSEEDQKEKRGEI